MSRPAPEASDWIDAAIDDLRDFREGEPDERPSAGFL